MPVLEEILNVVMVFVCPPLAVYWERYQYSQFSFWMNIALTLFFCIPGMVHAFFIMFTQSDVSPEKKGTSSVRKPGQIESHIRSQLTLAKQMSNQKDS